MRIKKPLWSTCALLLMIIAFIVSQGQAAEVKLAWDPSPSNPAGYKLYYGQASRSYQSSITVGLQTDHKLTGLTDGQRYYFAATAYDTAGNESGYSNEVTTVASSTGLVAAYKFDEGSGTKATDASGLGNHGTISGATWTGGRYGKALYFDGVKAWVTIPDASSLDLTTGMTLEAWVHPARTHMNWSSVLVKEGSGIAPYYLYASSPDARVPAGGGFIGGSDQIVFGGTGLVAKTWTHLAMTSNGTTQQLYINGIQVASQAQSGTIPVSTGALRIGGNSIWGEYFQGRIDEVRVYNRALTASQIQSDMNAPVGVAGTTNVVSAGTSSVSASGKSQPNMKTRVVSALDKSRALRSTSLPAHTSNSSPSAASQILDSELMEVGEVEVDHTWKRIEFSKLFVNPVVIANTLSYKGAQPAVVKIHNVDLTGFDIRTQKWEDDDGAHVSETVGYIVIESGWYTLADGTLLEAGRVETDGTKPYESVVFKGKFNVLPVVITAASSIDDADTLTLRPRRITADGFQFSLQRSALDQSSQPTRTVSYIAWEPSLGTVDNLTFEVNRTPQITRQQFHSIPFGETFENLPVLLADVQMGKGDDLLNIRWANKDIHGAELMIDKEHDLAADPTESAWVVGYIAIR